MGNADLTGITGAGNVMLTTHFHLTARFGISGAIPLLIPYVFMAFTVRF